VLSAIITANIRSVFSGPFVDLRTKPQGMHSRKQVYDAELLRKPIQRIWKAANLHCSKRLKAIIPLWLRGHIETHGPNSQEVDGALLRISPHYRPNVKTGQRLIYETRKSITNPGTHLRKHVLIKTDRWDEFRPGSLKTNTMDHLCYTIKYPTPLKLFAIIVSTIREHNLVIHFLQGKSEVEYICSSCML
jgi:hypothetical protein